MLVEDIYICYTYPIRRVSPSSYKNQPLEKRYIIFKEIPRMAILFFRMRLVTVTKKLTSQ